MSIEDIFDSAVRSAGDLAGVFEYDGETAYFYLYQTAAEGDTVLDAIHLFSGRSHFSADDLAIRWDVREDKVGLFIRGELWAVFDAATRSKFGGEYIPGAASPLPNSARDSFVHDS